MKHLTDQIRRLSEDVIAHNAISLQLKDRDKISVDNDPSYKQVGKLHNNIKVTLRRTSRKLVEYDHIDENVLRRLEEKKSVLRDGKKLLLAVFEEDIEVGKCHYSELGRGKVFLEHRYRYQEHETEDKQVCDQARSVIIKDDISFVSTEKIAKESNKIISTTTSLSFATKEDLICVLHKIVDLY